MHPHRNKKSSTPTSTHLQNLLPKSSPHPHSAQCLARATHRATKPSLHLNVDSNPQHTRAFPTSPLGPLTPAANPTNFSLQASVKYSPQLTPKRSNICYRSLLLLIDSKYSPVFALSSANFCYSGISKNSPSLSPLCRQAETSLRRADHTSYSHTLGRNRNMLANAHSIRPVLALPASQGRFFEFENNRLLHEIRNQEITPRTNSLFRRAAVLGSAPALQPSSAYTSSRSHSPLNPPSPEAILAKNTHTPRVKIPPASPTFCAFCLYTLRELKKSALFAHPSPNFYLRTPLRRASKNSSNQPPPEMFQLTDNPIPFLICSRLQVERQPLERTQPELAGADSPLEVHHEGL